ncbi:hypothetical protein TWF569_005148 [Orbilia oligospora]|uniref:Uncharacterized protein n=1 Tax=Orbilia oligospora TaxID=2813651 RepID=A0A7C8JH36_ORBOL|nr:hypothetical protein TWF706_005291 [Orbilia oligospora]KAF3108661.1 hypothetical protein TWF102_010783 [Orbilia oligospora]KAF3109987.1 hypothetical protein TWF103_004817 [Orbilia oligospora]KAF3149535.1 hypothetical protein TWF569_005148 [Orbilia oligospora]KAF3153315.1 hypothetical protein TWF594_000335 [Orbilia oligospora]
MYSLRATVLLAIFGLTVSQTLDEDRVYPLNATGERRFPAPYYSTRLNPSEWTARVALTRDDYFEGDNYRTATWLDTPTDVPVNGSSIIRDVCLFMPMPKIKRTEDIDYSKGENGCNDVLGGECVAKLKSFLSTKYEARTAQNGTMNCNSTQNVGSWRQYIYDICPVYKEAGGSGFSFKQLIPSNHETGSPLHGNGETRWIAMATPRNTTDVTPEEQYDEVSQYVFTYTFISGPEYENPGEKPTVEVVCVKAENVVEGSRELPSIASFLGVERQMFMMTFGFMVISVLFL